MPDSTARPRKAAVKQKIVVIGAGPVGALAALYAAKRGHDVEVYELRDDLRLDDTPLLNFTRSINLALSERGINAIRHAHSPALLDDILADTVPMHGRMVHTQRPDGALDESAQRYDAFGRFQRAADRGGLNKRLLDELEAMPNVRLFFSHKLTGADFGRNLAWLEDRTSPGPKWHTTLQTKASHRPNEIEIAFDLLIGADGAHSAARFHLMKFARVSYAQEYIDTLWCEFHIAPARDARGRPAFAISPDHLHIWPSPSRQFMFIAIPSADRSFTCTLFLPAPQFAALDADPAARLLPFFDQHFPGVARRLIPAADLLAQYTSSPHLPLISIKCAPYHFAGSAVILGDAAHAMLPFYGQGMNAGLEDVRVLFAQLDAAGASSAPDATTARAARARALAAYTALRAPDAHAVNDLASGNYAEMRSAVVSPLYRLRKRVEELLAVRAPWSGFATQYARVSFSDQRYSDVVRAVEWQGWVLGWAGTVAAGLVVGGAWGVWRALRTGR